jgi:hypothetical protein
MPNRQLKDLETSLHRVYVRIYKEIKKEPDYPDNLGAIRRKYNKLVYDNTRSAIQEAVILANEKVNRIFKTQPYLTQRDLNLIEKNSKDQTESFWRKIMLDIFRKQEQRLLGGATLGDEDEEDDGSLAPPPPPDVDITAYLLAVAIASLFGSLADATLSKSTELADTVETKPKVKWKAVVDQRTCKQLPDLSPGCGARNGTVYETDDPDLLEHMPGTGTHLFCRCYLESVL